MNAEQLRTHIYELEALLQEATTEAEIAHIKKELSKAHILLKMVDNP